MSYQGRILTVFISLLSCSSLFANRAWEKITISNAFCADGTEYNIFISEGRKDKLSIKFQGGGACWNTLTCFDIPVSRSTALETVKEVEGFISDDPEFSPVHDYTMIYIPYCTGDAFAGTHIANYSNKNYNHHGAINTKEAMHRTLSSMDLSSFDTVVIEGSSAGALGAMLHIHNISPYLEHIPTKRFIADSPGLHFGEMFWSKFTPKLFNDYKKALATLNFEVDRWNGNLSQSFKNLCEMYPEWDFTMIQASQDWVMSVIFGNSSQMAHENLIYSDEGIAGLTRDPKDNCASFIPSIDEHEILKTNDNLTIRAGNTTAIDYVRGFVKNGAGPNYLYW